MLFALILIIILAVWLYTCVVAGARADRRLRRLSAERFGLKNSEP